MWTKNSPLSMPISCSCIPPHSFPAISLQCPSAVVFQIQIARQHFTHAFGDVTTANSQKRVAMRHHIAAGCVQRHICIQPPPPLHPPNSSRFAATINYRATLRFCFGLGSVLCWSRYCVDSNTLQNKNVYWLREIFHGLFHNTRVYFTVVIEWL